MPTPDHLPVGPLATVEMKALHGAFRREYAAAPALVRSVRPGDLARARTVGRHLEFVERVLHHHHTVEDDLLWPRLLRRVPAEVAPVVELMESQHAVVDGCLTRSRSLRERWTATADAEPREQLAGLLDRLHAALVEHLDAEEVRVLPLVETAVTHAEWAELGRAGQSAFPGREGLLVFGMVQRDAGDAVVAGMLAGAPAPVRFVLPRLARRTYRRHHGALTPVA
ncbi:hemerythrin domain-containing protein [Phycicoccus flavus]|uniref:hemerythrin domain-containing protein n=1 Tax=Phycicoccus flavus TaxID=2502783 RepID=UPI000FEB9CA2|nr:hemerythrin domain-containing protein [Phycicoccus flavus]NHA66742.1 hemerythrin domain-containing protein [Phycicoccus flavus]